MNLKTFAQALSLPEINELSNILWEMKKEYAEQNLKPLSEWNKHVAEVEGLIPAIKHYRNNNDCSLLEAKLAVEKYLKEIGRR